VLTCIADQLVLGLSLYVFGGVHAAVFLNNAPYRVTCHVRISLFVIAFFYISYYDMKYG
jgi:hypothetical protein